MQLPDVNVLIDAHREDAPVDLLSVPIFGLTLSAVVTMAFVVSLAVKSVAAAGALLGSRNPL